MCALISEATDEKLTIEPPPFSTIAGTISCVHQRVPKKLVSTTS